MSLNPSNNSQVATRKSNLCADLISFLKESVFLCDSGGGVCNHSSSTPSFTEKWKLKRSTSFPFEIFVTSCIARKSHPRSCCKAVSSYLCRIYFNLTPHRATPSLPAVSMLNGSVWIAKIFQLVHNFISLSEKIWKNGENIARCTSVQLHKLKPSPQTDFATVINCLLFIYNLLEWLYRAGKFHDGFYILYSYAKEDCAELYQQNVRNKQREFFSSDWQLWPMTCKWIEKWETSADSSDETTTRSIFSEGNIRWYTNCLLAYFCKCLRQLIFLSIFRFLARWRKSVNLPRAEHSYKIDEYGAAVLHLCSV